VGRDGIDGKAADYKALATKIKDANPDLIYFGGITQNNARQLLKDIRAAGITVPFMGPDGILESAFIEAAGADIADALVTTDQLDAGDIVKFGADHYAIADAGVPTGFGPELALFGAGTVVVGVVLPELAVDHVEVLVREEIIDLKPEFSNQEYFRRNQQTLLMSSSSSSSCIICRRLLLRSSRKLSCSLPDLFTE